MDDVSMISSSHQSMRKLSVLLGVGLVLLLQGCGEKAAPPPPPQKVNIQEVRAHDIEYLYEYPGVVQGVVDYPVIPRVSGAIFKQLYKEGSFVKKDQPLYEIDKRPYQFALQTYEGQYEKDLAAVENYKIILDRYERLKKNDVVSVQDINTATINYKAASGNLMTDIANINNAKLNLEYCTVRAPATGHISERMVSEGMMVTAFDTHLNVINSMDSMYAAFSMPELDRLGIENGQLNQLYRVPENLRFGVDLVLADGTRIDAAGTVEFKDVRVTFDNGVWQMRATINNASLTRNKLIAGQFVRVILRNLYVTQSYNIPQESIFRDQESNYVMIEENNVVHKHRIKAGKYLADGTQIVEAGLTDGMHVVTNGGVRVTDNDPVTVDQVVKDAMPQP